jgi:hypothetical protein
MGITIDNGQGGSSSKLFLYVALGSSQPKKSIFYFDPSSKEKVFVRGITGEIVNITKNLKSPKEFPDYWAYQITFEDNSEDAEYKHMVLEVRKESGFTDQIINRLAGVTEPREITIGVYEKNGYPKVHITQGGNKVEWKHPFDKAPIPDVEVYPTRKKDEVTGEPIMDRDRSKRSEFVEEMVKTMYYFFSGQVWSAANILGQNNANVSYATPNPDAYKTILAGIKKNFKDAPTFLSKLSVICDRINTEVSDYMEKQNLMAEITVHINSLSSKTYELDLKTKSYKEVEPPKEDDLPF